MDDLPTAIGIGDRAMPQRVDVQSGQGAAPYVVVGPDIPSIVGSGRLATAKIVRKALGGRIGSTGCLGVGGDSIAVVVRPGLTGFVRTIAVPRVEVARRADLRDVACRVVERVGTCLDRGAIGDFLTHESTTRVVLHFSACVEPIVRIGFPARSVQDKIRYDVLGVGIEVSAHPQ